MGFVVPPREQGAKMHLPVAIVIDRSESTEDIRQLLNQCARKLLRSLKEDPFLGNLVELLVVHYSHDYDPVVDFRVLRHIGQHDLDIHRSEGPTNTGGALLYALQRLGEKKMEWKLAGEKYFQPLLFLLTDGYPDAGLGAPADFEKRVSESYEMAAEQIRELEQQSKLVFVAAGIQQENGYSANMNKLRQLSLYPERIMHITDAAEGVGNLEQFYNLILDATNAVSQGTPIDDVIDGFIHA